MKATIRTIGVHHSIQPLSANKTRQSRYQFHATILKSESRWRPSISASISIPIPTLQFLPQQLPASSTLVPFQLPPLRSSMLFPEDASLFHQWHLANPHPLPTSTVSNLIPPSPMTISSPQNPTKEHYPGGKWLASGWVLSWAFLPTTSQAALSN